MQRVVGRSCCDCQVFICGAVVGKRWQVDLHVNLFVVVIEHGLYGEGLVHNKVGSCELSQQTRVADLGTHGEIVAVLLFVCQRCARERLDMLCHNILHACQDRVIVELSRQAHLAEV